MKRMMMRLARLKQLMDWRSRWQERVAAWLRHLHLWRETGAAVPLSVWMAGLL